MNILLFNKITIGTLIFAIVMLHLLAGFGYALYKIQFGSDKKSAPKSRAMNLQPNRRYRKITPLGALAAILGRSHWCDVQHYYVHCLAWAL
jgi:hypothetical protein